MPAVQVKKVVAVCFLEATKLTLEHLAAYRLELGQRATSPTSPDLARLYGELRRLRDHLQRCASAYQEIVELDLSPTDVGLLVACCRRAVEAIDQKLEGEQAVAHDEKQWLQKKRQVLADWAVELADKPLVDLPMPRVTPHPTEGGRMLLSRLQQKLFGDVAQRTKIRAPTAGINSMTAGARSCADDLATPIATEDEAPPAGALPHVPSTAFGLPDVVEAPAPLVEAAHFRDPRLRTLVAMDLAALARAQIARDFRLATVLLCSVLEAAIVDQASTRRGELGLGGTPDSWNLQQLLLQLMGGAFGPKDHALAYHLFASRNLLRPALQIVTPTIVTPSSFERLRDFVQRALHAMGFGTARSGPECHAQPSLPSTEPI